MKTKQSEFSRRKAIKSIGVGLAGAALLPACSNDREVVHAPKLDPKGVVGKDGNRVKPWQNWSGNQNCQPSSMQVPTTVEEVAKSIKESEGKIRFVGTGHSFSPLVPTDDNIVSLGFFTGIKSVNKELNQATIGGGSYLMQIGDPLWADGLGLRNMPDINRQSLAGSIATSTHGTGKNFGSLSSDVAGLQIVNGNGDIVTCSAEENTDLFYAARNHLGMLGAVTDVTMQLQPKFNLEEKKWFVPAEEGFAQAESLRDNNRHFEMYAFPHADYLMMITINETDQPAMEPSEPEKDDAILEMKKWSERFSWFKSYLINSALKDEVGKTSVRRDRSYYVYGNVRDILFNEMEYSVPADRGVECLQEVLATIKKQNLDVVFPIEYRYVKADDIWLSPFYKRDSCAISCHNFHDRDYKKYFAEIEKVFLKYGGRPHWGKLNTLGKKDFMDMYEHWDDFARVRKEMDPNNKFENAYTKRLFS